MRVTIISDDGVVGVDGEFRQVDLSALDANIHAVQWDGAIGHIEFKDRSPNEAIDDFVSFQSFVTAWNAAAPPPLPPPPLPPKKDQIIDAAFTGDALVPEGWKMAVAPAFLLVFRLVPRCCSSNRPRQRVGPSIRLMTTRPCAFRLAGLLSAPAARRDSRRSSALARRRVRILLREVKFRLTLIPKTTIHPAASGRPMTALLPSSSPRAPRRPAQRAAAALTATRSRSTCSTLT